MTRRSDSAAAENRAAVLVGGADGAGTLARADREEGSSSVELVIVMTLVMLLLMLVVQFALCFCALHVTQAAVAEAAANAGSADGTANSGTAQARQILTAAGSGFFTATDVAVSRTPTVTTVRIYGTVTSIVPFLHLSVSSITHSPNEILTTASPENPVTP